MILCRRIVLYNLFGNHLIAVGTGQDSGQNLRLPLFISHPEHIRGVGQIIQGARRRGQFFLRYNKGPYIPPMDVHFPFGQEIHLPGEKAHGVQPLRLGNPNGEHLGVLLQVEVILDDVILELLPG